MFFLNVFLLQIFSRSVYFYPMGKFSRHYDLMTRGQSLYAFLLTNSSGEDMSMEVRDT